MDAQKFQELIKKINAMKQRGQIDLSLEEDLSIAVMNLVSLEEHFFFTAQKTGKDDYFDLLNETREIRKALLGRMVDRHEGETWCITKHLLAATMRLIEVGTKLLGEEKKNEAREIFDHAYRLYGIFWGLRLKLISLANVKKVGEKQLDVHDTNPTSAPWSMKDIINKLMDCCKE